MNWRKLFMLALCINLFPFHLLAQKVKPGFMIEAGVALGVNKAEVARALMQVNYKDWFGGIGAGFDATQFENYQPMLSAGRYLGQRKIKPFVMASGGLNLPEKKFIPGTKPDQPEIWRQWWFLPDTKYLAGFFGEAAAGIHFRGKGGHGFVLSLSQSIKTLRENKSSQLYNPVTRKIEPAQESFLYKIHSLNVRLGYKF